MTTAEQRAAVVAEARTWLRTPFCHAERLKGVGVDCAQLLIAVYSATGMVPPIRTDYYSPDWFNHQTAQLLRSIVAEHCIATDDPQAGDIVLFRFGRADAHAAICVDFPRIIHADRTIGLVAEDMAGPFDALGARLAGCWTFPQWSVSHV